jgi:hypothetical protein
VFDGNGKYEAQWNNLHRPCGLYMHNTKHPVCYIGELGPVMGVNRNSPNLGPRVSIVDHQGKLLSRFGDPHAGTAPTAFLGPHGLTVDSRGDLYVGEVRANGVSATASMRAGSAVAVAASAAAGKADASARSSVRSRESVSIGCMASLQAKGFNDLLPRAGLRRRRCRRGRPCGGAKAPRHDAPPRGSRHHSPRR